jgi:PEP-CTERM motif
LVSRSLLSSSSAFTQSRPRRNQRNTSKIGHDVSVVLRSGRELCFRVVVLSIAGVVTGKADIILDPLHGCFIGTSCSESNINGTNVTPTTTNPVPTFTFTDSPGPITGDLLIEILIPDNTPGAASLAFAIGGTQAGPTDTSTIAPVSSSLKGHWSTGTLEGFLGLNAQPTNPLSSFLTATQFVDSSAGGYYVFQVDLGTNELQKTNNPTVPIFSLSGNPVPAGSVLTAYESNGSSYIATASSGGLFEQSGPPASAVPEPSSILLLAAVAASAVAILRRRVHS